MRRDKRIRKKLRARTSLSYKLTGYFVVFGLIIGYSVFIYATSSQGRNALEMLTNVVQEELEMNEDAKKRFNEINFKENLIRISDSMDTEDLPLSNMAAYVKTGDKWKRYSYTEDSIHSDTVYAEKNRLLMKAAEDGMAFSNPIFLGKSDSASVYFTIPLETEYKIILSAEVNRQGVDHLLADSREELTGFGIILIACSFILGKLFASRITRPLKKLATNAIMISEGEEVGSLQMRRRDEIGVLSNALCNMRGDLNERLLAMEIMNKIDKAVLSSISRNDLLSRVVGFVCDYIDKSTVVMALRDEVGGGYELTSAVRQSEPVIMIDNPYIPDELLSSTSREMFRTARVFSEDRNLTEVLIKQLNLPKKTKRFYNVPIYLQEHYLGSLLVIKADQQSFTEEQQQTLRKLGDQVGVALQSVQAVEEMNSLQIGSIRALSRAIDAKSEWTAGHSDRVAELSEKLGIAAGLGETDLRRLVISALLHDIGKIGVSESLLDKPGKLTNEEFDLIKQHPDMGYKIIANIPDYEDISDGIRFHHERWNGKGYPLGLKGKETPLFGRIIAIADVFDALSEERPYRKGWSFDECIQFITDKRGIDFDPELADKFIEAMTASNNQLQN